MLDRLMWAADGSSRALQAGAPLPVLALKHRLSLRCCCREEGLTFIEDGGLHITLVRPVTAGGPLDSLQPGQRRLLRRFDLAGWHPYGREVPHRQTTLPTAVGQPPARQLALPQRMLVCGRR